MKETIMKTNQTGQKINNQTEPTRSVSRRGFLKKSLAASAAVPVMMSFEERNLMAQTPPAAAPAKATETGTLPKGKIGNVEISRIICGGNLISGYAHSRDLIYVSHLLKAYFTDAKIMETWSLCEQQGINTMIFNPSDEHALRVYGDYKRQGGKIQCIAQVDAPKKNMAPFIKGIADYGVDGIVLVGNVGDRWSRDNDSDSMGQFIEQVQLNGIVAGIGGHELRTPMLAEKAGLKADFYMKTYHSTSYWSTRRPDQDKDVIDNYNVDNYWCKDPDTTKDFMASVKRPWMAYKVLAAGAVHPHTGFKHAFEGGADFCVVGMFDFQISENANVLRQVLAGKIDRKRAWVT